MEEQTIHIEIKAERFVLDSLFQFGTENEEPVELRVTMCTMDEQALAAITAAYIYRKIDWRKYLRCVEELLVTIEDSKKNQSVEFLSFKRIINED